MFLFWTFKFILFALRLPLNMINRNAKIRMTFKTDSNYNLPSCTHTCYNNILEYKPVSSHDII
jgi:hypothetical protein